MRIAVGIIALALTIPVFLQSCGVGFGGAMAEDADLGAGAGAGYLVAFALLFGGAFAFRLPRLGVVLLALAGGLALIGYASTPYTDLVIWGVIAWILAGLLVVGVIAERRRSRRASWS